MIKQHETAVREIVLITWPCEDANNKENKQWIDQKVAQFNAIIEKHCSQDKAVGRLVTATKDMVAAAATDNPDAWHSAVINLEAALTDYEGKK